MDQFGRRRFVAALGATALAKPLVSLAQARTKVPRIGVLTSDSAQARTVLQIRRHLHESFGRAGYEVGRNIFLEWRFGEGKRERMDQLADSLVRLDVDVIVAWSVYATHAAARATQTIPIVMVSYFDDPVKRGLVASLARPGGNVTGATWTVDLVGQSLKQYELLKQAVPTAVRVASLWWPWGPDAQQWVAKLHERINKELGLVVTDFVVHSAEEVPSALDRIAIFKPDALFVASFPVFRARLGEIAAFAIREKLVSFGTEPIVVREGVLLYYGPDGSHVVDRAVSFVHRILRGAKPGDLPVEQPAKFEFLFNSKTAKAIGYTLPPELRISVDQVIE